LHRGAISLNGGKVISLVSGDLPAQALLSDRLSPHRCTINML
jgi:hypothetical protein